MRGAVKAGPQRHRDPGGRPPRREARGAGRWGATTIKSRETRSNPKVFEPKKVLAYGHHRTGKHRSIQIGPEPWSKAPARSMIFNEIRRYSMISNEFGQKIKNLCESYGPQPAYVHRARLGGEMPRTAKARKSMRKTKTKRKNLAGRPYMTSDIPTKTSPCGRLPQRDKPWVIHGNPIESR